MSYAKSFINTFLDSPIISNGRDQFLINVLEARQDRSSLRGLKGRRAVERAIDFLQGRDLEALDPREYEGFDHLLTGVDLSRELIRSIALSNIIALQASEGARAWGLPEGFGLEDHLVNEVPEKAHEWYGKSALFRQYVDLLATARARGSKRPVKVSISETTFYGDEYNVLVEQKGLDHILLLSYEQILMFKDMYHSRFNSLVTCQVIYNSSSLTDAVIDCLDWFLQCLTRYGNRGYEIGKQIEALSKTNLIRMNDPYFSVEGTHFNMMNKIRQKEQGFGGSSPYQCEKLDSILQRMQLISHAVELFGLQKLSGHPLIDPRVGGRSVISKARSKINYRSLSIRRLRNNFCRMYTEGYIRRNTHWPPLVFEPHARSTRLFSYYSHQELNIHRKSYDIMEWEGVRFAKHLEFDYYPNFTDLMDDKSISYYRSEVASTWVSSTKPSSHKRLLIEMLSRPEISVREIVEAVSRGDIPFPWLVVSLYPKEREFKISARMFSMMVFEMRAFFTATEANLADHVFPNLPQQTMTLTQLEVQELFHRATDPSSDEDWKKLYLEFDISLWNLGWHPEVVDPIGHDFNDMFGTPGTFTVVHHFFKRCAIVVRVAGLKPYGIEEIQRPEADISNYESPLMWGDHEVGFEGIFQKGWTAPTFSMIDLGMNAFNLQYYLIGQADNQTILALVNCTHVLDVEGYLRDLADGITTSVNRECSLVGQDAKPEECIASSQSITYSKKVFIEGVEYFTSIKAFSRMFAHAPSDFPSLSNSVGALSGQAIAAAEMLKKPTLGFYLWCLFSSLYLVSLKRSPPVEALMVGGLRGLSLSDRELYGLLLLPGELGGLTTAPLTMFLYKGGADPLSKAYASLKFFQSSSGLIRKVVSSLHHGAWMKKAPDVRLCLDDPYGIPLDNIGTPEISILQDSMRKVRSLAKNKPLSELASVEMEAYDKHLRDELVSVRPFNPVLCADVYGWSIAGTRKSVGKMFTATRTVQALLQGAQDIDVCQTILNRGASAYLLTRSRIRSLRSAERCISDIYADVERLRGFWDPEGLNPLVGVTSYTPFDFRVELSMYPIREQGIKLMIKSATLHNPNYTRGDSDPYLGRATQEKRSVHGYKIITSSAPERAIKRLSDIATQPGVSSSFIDLIARVAQTRGGIDLKATLPYLGDIYGGMICHRYGSRLGMRAAHGLGSMCMASNCNLSTNTASPISGGVVDYPRMIQEDMVCCIALAQVSWTPLRPWMFYCIRTDTPPMSELLDAEILVPDCERYSFPILRDNIIAYQEDILLQQVSGPLNIFALGVFAPTAHKVLDVRYALRRTAHRAMYLSRSASGVADRRTGSIRFKLDVLELRGCSLSEVSDAIAHEACQFVIEGMFTRPYEDVRWTPLPMSIALSEGFARSLMTYISHPLMRSDPTVISLGLVTGLRYRVGPLTALSKLRDYIASKVRKYLSDASASVYTDPEVIFLDDYPTSASRAVLRRLKVMTYQAMILGEISPTSAYRIIRHNLPMVYRAEVTELGRLDALYRFIAGTLGWCIATNRVTLSEHLSSLLAGRSVMRYESSAPEVVRLSRSFTVLERLDNEYNLFQADETRDSIRVIRVETPPTRQQPLGGPMWNSPHNKIEYDMFNAHRLLGREYGKDSSAGYSYLAIAHLTNKQVVVNVGCGYGSGAAVLLRTGSSHVYGLDLWEDLDDQSYLDGPPLPAAVVETSTGSRFTRIEVSPEMSGDIHAYPTIEAIRSYVGIGGVFVVDIPLTTRDDVLSLYHSLSLFSGLTRTLVRWIGLSSQMVDLVACLVGSCVDVSLYHIYGYNGYSEVWIRSDIPRGLKLLGFRGSLMADLPNFSFTPYDLSWLGGGKDYLSTILYSAAALTEGEELELSMESAGMLVASAMGEYEHRFSYRQWTNILHSWILYQIHTDPNPLEAVALLITSDTHTVEISGVEILAQVGPALIRLATRLLPRLLST